MFCKLILSFNFTTDEHLIWKNLKIVLSGGSINL